MTAKIMEMDLVVKIEGGVQDTNLLEFEKAALDIINGFNLSPNTDLEYSRAESDAKDCKVLEDRLQESKKVALSKIEDINSLFNVIDSLYDGFRTARLTMEKKVKGEKERRKKEIIEGAISKARETHKNSVVSHEPMTYEADIRAAAKNKRTVESLKESVEEVLQSFYDHISERCETWESNITSINYAENERPGLFPDKNTIALKPPAEVELIIQGRTGDFDLKQAQRKLDEAARRTEEKKRTVLEPKPTFDDFPEFTPTGPVLERRIIEVTLYGAPEVLENFVTILNENKIVQSVYEVNDEEGEL